jgi:hypothetical protein
MILLTPVLVKDVLRYVSGENDYSYIFLAFAGPIPTKDSVHEKLQGVSLHGSYTLSDFHSAVNQSANTLLLSGVWTKQQVQPNFINDFFLRLPMETVDNSLTLESEGIAEWACVIAVSGEASTYNSPGDHQVLSLYLGPVGDIGEAASFELLAQSVEKIRDHSLSNIEITFGA